MMHDFVVSFVMCVVVTTQKVQTRDILRSFLFLCVKNSNVTRVTFFSRVAYTSPRYFRHLCVIVRPIKG